MAKIQRQFTLNAPFQMGAIRLRTLAHQVDQALRSRRRQRALWGLALLLVLIGIGAVIYKTGWDGLVMVLFIGGVIDLVLFGYAFTYRTGSDLILARDLSSALHRWRFDAHSASPLQGELDWRYPGDCPPKRTVRSGGGKKKEYYHYVPLHLKFALADGNLLALQVDVKAKTKAGSEIRRTAQIRGRIKLNLARYRAPAAGQALTQPDFNIRCVNRHGESHLCFWGELTHIAQLQQNLNDLYRSVRALAY